MLQRRGARGAREPTAACERIASRRDRLCASVGEPAARARPADARASRTSRAPVRERRGAQPAHGAPSRPRDAVARGDASAGRAPRCAPMLRRAAPLGAPVAARCRARSRPQQSGLRVRVRALTSGTADDARRAPSVTIVSRPLWRIRLARELPRYLLCALSVAGLAASARFAIAPPSPAAPVATVRTTAPSDPAAEAYAVLFARRYLTWNAAEPQAGSRRRSNRSLAPGWNPTPGACCRASGEQRVRMGRSRAGARTGARRARLHGRRADRHRRAAVPDGRRRAHGRRRASRSPATRRSSARRRARPRGSRRTATKSPNRRSRRS